MKATNKNKNRRFRILNKTTNEYIPNSRRAVIWNNETYAINAAKYWVKKGHDVVLETLDLVVTETRPVNELVKELLRAREAARIADEEASKRQNEVCQILNDKYGISISNATTLLEKDWILSPEAKKEVSELVNRFYQ